VLAVSHIESLSIHEFATTEVDNDQRVFTVADVFVALT
jgi:hypothetical protein